MCKLNWLIYSLQFMMVERKMSTKAWCWGASSFTTLNGCMCHISKGGCSLGGVMCSLWVTEPQLASDIQREESGSTQWSGPIPWALTQHFSIRFQMFNLVLLQKFRGGSTENIKGIGMGTNSQGLLQVLMRPQPAIGDIRGRISLVS